MQLDRRRDERKTRFTTGVGIGLPLAVVISYIWELKTGKALPNYVEAALGSIITTASICFHDLRWAICLLIWRYVRNRRKVDRENTQ